MELREITEQNKAVPECFRQLPDLLKDFPGFTSPVKQISEKDESVRFRVGTEPVEQHIQLSVTTMNIADYIRSQLSIPS